MTRAILHGFSEWLTIPPSGQPQAHTISSLHPADILLTSAFHEQFYSITWYQFCLGRLSKKWALALSEYTKISSPAPDPDFWASLLINQLWLFTLYMWRHRNQVVHGTTIEDQAQKLLDRLHQLVTNYYQQFAEDPSIILAQHHYLFNRPLTQHLNHSYDYIQCWIKSVDEAKLVKDFQETANGENALHFFPRPPPISTGTSSTDSTYAYASDSDVSIALTATTASLTSSSCDPFSTLQVSFSSSHDDNSSIGSQSNLCFKPSSFFLSDLSNS